MLPRWPEGLEPTLTEVDVAISRTRAEYDGYEEIREIEQCCGFFGQLERMSLAPGERTELRARLKALKMRQAGGGQGAGSNFGGHTILPCQNASQLWRNLHQEPRFEI